MELHWKVEYPEYYEWVEFSLDPIIRALIVDRGHVNVPENGSGSILVKYHIKVKN